MSNLLDIMGSDFEHDSRRWFPHIYADDAAVPLPTYFALATAGEVGEMCNFVKKLNRDADKYSAEDVVDLKKQIGFELVDSFIYILLMARSLNLDMDALVAEKRQILMDRWGAE